MRAAANLRSTLDEAFATNSGLDFMRDSQVSAADKNAGGLQGMTRLAQLQDSRVLVSSGGYNTGDDYGLLESMM